MCNRTMENKKIIDIEPLVRQSKNKFIRNLPSWTIKLIKKIICEDDLNRIYIQFQDLQGIDFLRAVLFQELKVKVEYYCETDIDPNGRYIYIANHPLGAVDAMAHFDLMYKHHNRGVSPSNELFEVIPNLHSIITGVNVFGRNPKHRAVELNELFASDIPVMMFPAGEVSRLIGFSIRDPQWKKTFITKAVKYQRDIVPSFISGRNSFYFYLIAKLRKLLGIKLYIETMLLPREMLNKYDYNLKIYTLSPIKWQEIANSGKDHIWWLNEIYKRVYQVRKKL